MADPKDFMSPRATRRGGTIGELRKSAVVATTDGTPNAAGPGRGNTLNDPRIVNQAAAGRGFVHPPFVKPDAYAHQTSNVVTSGDDLKLNIAFQANILDNFDSYTYHWKLFIVDPESSANGAVLNTANQTIIAESGVSDLTIDKVDIRGITTPSVETGTGVSTDVKFEIVEPAGAGLIDKIFYQAIALGIGNWSVMPVYLQLQFRARDPGTSESLTDGAPANLSTLKWLWALKLTRIKANVTTVGTRYEFEAIVYNELAQSNAYFTMQSNVVLNNLTNVQSAMTELTDKLNADQLLKLIDNYSIPDVFNIVVDPKIAGKKITPYNNNADSARSGSMTDIDKKDASFAPGTSVDKIIDSVLSHTAEYQTGVVGSNTPGGEGQPATSEKSQMKPFWRIITESRPIIFDPRRLDDAREFTIYVIEYDIGVLDSNVFQESNGPDSIEAERKRLATYFKKSILKKKYNYIFTGLNDQVMNLDLTVNNAFAVSQARMGGIYNNLAMASKGIITQEHALEEANITERLSAAISFNNTASTDPETQRLGSRSNDATREAISNSNLPDATKKRYITLLENSKPESRMNFLKEAQSRGGINNDATMNASRIKATNLAKPQYEKITGQQLNFISDVNTNLKDPNNTDTINSYNNYLASVKGKLRPIAHIEQMQDKQIGSGIESSSNSGVQKLSSMFSVALHSSLDSSFQKLKITIKGDPFWLFPQPFSGDSRPIYNSLKAPDVAIEWIKNAHSRDAGDYANYFGTDNFMIIRFRTPRIYNIEDDTSLGKDAYTDVETFSGVYKVVSVTSSFASGIFKQELDCILDPFINIINFTDEIENNAKKADVPTINAELMNTSIIPPTAIKKPKLETDVSTKGVVSEGATATTLGKSLANDGKIAREQGQKMLDALRGK